MRQPFLVIVTLLILGSCTAEKKSQPYLRWVGDIPSNNAIDDPDFELCLEENWVKQYFHFDQGGLQYAGEKPAMDAYFQSNYQPVNSTESGWIRIRFIVNCKGETGRFRMIASDTNYEPYVFNQGITDQLMELTRKMDGWAILPNTEKPRDYYQYLVFKIESGQISEILP